MTAEQSKCPGCAEATEEELLQQLDDVLQEYADTPGALIPVLQIAQTMFGYLPEPALKKIALGAGQAVQRSGRRGELLFLLFDRTPRQAFGAGLPGHGLLRSGG